MKVTFIRHGQSTGNTGVPCHDLATIELTEKGWDQARRVAADWTETPSMIVTSPFMRTQQTAAPTIERFPDVPVEVWAIEEFTYLQPSRWNGTLTADRAPHLERYWKEADPDYCDGEGAESFGTLLRRAEAALTRLAALVVPGPIYVFSHGQFIQAVRAVIVQAELDKRDKMLRFWRKGEPPAVSNAERVMFVYSASEWSLSY